MKKAYYIVFIVFLAACQSPKDSTSDTPSAEVTISDTKEAFPWNERTALVIYAGNSGDDNPDESFESLIIKDYDAEKNFLVVDGAPNLTVLDAQQMREELESVTSKGLSDAEQALVNEINHWVSKKTEEGHLWFLYELEPPTLAGKAYPIAVLAE